MELVDIKQEILGQGIGVGKALQNTVHETGVAQVLKACDPCLRVFPHLLKHRHSHPLLLFFIEFRLVPRHLLELVRVAFLLQVPF